jgi:extradiol dioxygenase family protein
LLALSERLVGRKAGASSTHSIRFATYGERMETRVRKEARDSQYEHVQRLDAE